MPPFSIRTFDVVINKHRHNSVCVCVCVCVCVWGGGGAGAFSGPNPPHFWGFCIPHNYTHTHTYLVEIWTSDQPVAEATTYTTHNKTQQRTSVHSAGFEPEGPSNQTATYIRLRPHDYWDTNTITCQNLLYNRLEFITNLMHNFIYSIIILHHDQHVSTAVRSQTVHCMAAYRVWRYQML
jgi:hypothetical protein